MKSYSWVEWDFFNILFVAQTVPIEITKDIASETGTSVSTKSLWFNITKYPFAGFGVVGINTETKLFSHIAFSKLSSSSQVKNQTDQVFSVGNLVRITFLNEFVFCKVFAAWFVILVKEFNNGTFSTNGSKTAFTLSHTRHWFITNHNNRINPHKTKNHKKLTTISGSHNLSIITSGNNSTIFQTHLNISENNHQRITKNRTVGKTNNNPVIKWLFIFLFASLISNMIHNKKYINIYTLSSQTKL